MLPQANLTLSPDYQLPIVDECQAAKQTQNNFFLFPLCFHGQLTHALKRSPMTATAGPAAGQELCSCAAWREAKILGKQVS